MWQEVYLLAFSCWIAPQGQWFPPAMLGCSGPAWGWKTLSGHLELDTRKVKRTQVGTERSVCADVAETKGRPRGVMQGTRGISYTFFYFILNPKINHIFLLNELSPGRKCFVLKTLKSYLQVSWNQKELCFRTNFFIINCLYSKWDIRLGQQVHLRHYV